MKQKIPKTPFATRLSGSTKETELRIRSIFLWKKKRPPLGALLVIIVMIIGAGSLVGFAPVTVESQVGQQEHIDYSEMILPEFYVTSLDDSMVVNEAFLQAMAQIVRDDIVCSTLGDKPSLSGENLIKLFQRVMDYAYPAELIDSWAGEIPLEAVEAVLELVLLDYNKSEFYGYLEFRSNCFNKETKTITLQEDELEPAITIQSADLIKLESLTAQLGYEKYYLEYSGEPSYSLEITFSLNEKVLERQALVTLYQGAIRIYGTDLVYGPGM